MYKDFHYLKRCVHELNKNFAGSTIREAYTQEKNHIYFAIPSLEAPHRHLIFSTNPQSQYMLYKVDHKKAKRNVINFFDETLPDKIENIMIAENDRVIRVKMSNSEIYFAISGVKSNVYLISNNHVISSFKKIKTDKQFLSNHGLMNFTDNYDISVNMKINSKLPNYRELKTQLPFLSKILYDECFRRISEGIEIEFDSALKNCIKNILYDDILVDYNEKQNEKIFQPITFQSNQEENKSTFPTYNDALQKYISIEHRFTKLNQEKERYLKQMERELVYLSNKLNNLKSRIDGGSKEEYYYKIGNLLFSAINKIPKGLGSIELIDPMTNESIKIKLNPNLSANQIVDYYFNKAKDERKDYKFATDNFNATLEKYEICKNKIAEMRNTSLKDDHKIIDAEIKNSRKSAEQNSDVEISGCKRYLISNKYLVLVGKDSKNNDILTFKIAKQNDYWFHARGYAGSHVVLKVENPKIGVPKSILNATASIAAYYSKARTSNLAPVSYTLRKFVHKRKGMEPGKVFMKQEKVLLVKPKLPDQSGNYNDGI